jgi:hypothetical protein
MRQKIRVCGINFLLIVFDFLVIPLAGLLGLILAFILAIYACKLFAYPFVGVFTFFIFSNPTLLESVQVFWWDVVSGAVVCVVFGATTWLWHKFSNGTKKEKAASQILDPVRINTDDDEIVELNKI